MNKYIYILLLMACISIADYQLKAQSENIYEDMSWDELSDIDIAVTATKRPEDLFEAPLSITILKKQQILNSGANSIPEALRLVPGLIVREISPGNFDVHIRGFDDITRSFITPLPMNTITLVMINNRPTYSYYLGGTLWDALPVDINDVKQIEVVRGPASALYGPNAVAGVINIITEHSTEEGVNTELSMTRGLNDQGYLNGIIGYNNGTNFKVSLSTNLAATSRFDDDYYSWERRSYIPSDSMKQIIEMRTAFGDGADSQDKDHSLMRFATNIFVDYSYNDNIDFKLATGISGSESRKVYINNFTTPMSKCISESKYVDIKSTIYGLNFQLFVESGNYDTDFSYNKHSYNNGIINLDYLLDFGEIKFRPSFGVTTSEYDKSPLLSGASLGDIIFEPEENVMKTLRTFNVSLFSEYQPTSQLRFVLGGRGDYYEHNKKAAYSFELASTYRMDKDNLFRFDIARATRSPFILETYVDLNVYGWAILRKPETEIRDTVPFITQYKGNTDLNFITQMNYEIGWRHKFSNSIKLDMELFIANISNFTVMKNDMVLSFNEVTGIPEYVLNSMQYKNVDNVDAHQYGYTLSLTYSPIENIDMRIYGTYQKTEIEVDEDSEDFLNQTKWENKSTPAITIGAELNWQFADKWNINANYYYMSKQEFAGLTESELGYGGIMHQAPYYDEVKNTNILNLSLRGNVYKRLWIKATARNILSKAKQYGFTDNIASGYLFGIEIK